MSNVLYLYEKLIATVELTWKVAQEVFERTDINCQFKQITKVTVRNLNESDVIVLIRPQNVLAVSIAKKAQKAGKFVIVFLDDDLLNLPKSMPLVPWRRKSLIATLKNADIVLSSNPYICEKYQNYTKKKRSTIQDTVVSIKDLQRIPKKGVDNRYPIKLVYAAGVNRADVFNQYILPCIRKLDEKYGDRISLTFVGVNPDFSQTGLRMKINHQKGMFLEEYREYMRNQKFDIGLAPLHEDSFSKCKYFNKYIEYTLVGVTGIYSNCEPYTFVVKDGINGFLADNTVESWFETICRAVENTNLRKSCISEAKKHLREKFNSDAIRDKILSDIPELIHPPESNESCESLFMVRIAYRLFRVADIIYLTFFYLHRKGLSGVFERIRMHMANFKLQIESGKRI